MKLPARVAMGMLLASSMLAADPPAFAAEVYPVLKAANCAGCHSVNGIASGTRLRFPADPATSEAIARLGLSLSALVNRVEPLESLLIQKPTGRLKHTGGTLIKPGSREESVLASWVLHLSRLPVDKTKPQPRQGPDFTPVELRRLTHTQYNNAVRDLLGDQTQPANRFPPEDFIDGFRNQSGTQGVPPLLAEAYSKAAERLAAGAFRSSDSDPAPGCRPSRADDEICASAFIRDFGRRVYRRALTASEQQRLLALFQTEARQAGSFRDGARAVLEAMLQSPNFLFRVERPADGKLSAYEIASRLSLLIWDTIPDESLLRAAESGVLDTPAGIERTARAMLPDQRSRSALDGFFSQWLRFDLLTGAVKDRRLYPQFTPELAAAMMEETRLLLNDLVWNDGNFMDLFRAKNTFVNSELAALYGIPAPPSEFAKVTLPEAGGRAGILGHASFLTLTSKPGDTSPTVRGLFVREHFLCQKVPDPPPGVNSNLPPVSPDKPQTNRERLAAHVADPACAGCHLSIDPIGFSFEKFDAIGKRREKLMLQFLSRFGQERKVEKQVPVELELDTTGELAGFPGLKFSSPVELGQILSTNDICQACIVRQYFRYAFGRRETDADEPAIQQMLADFRTSGFRFRKLILSLVRTEQFRAGKGS